MLALILALLLTFSATPVHHGDTITITMPVTSPDGAHVALLANDGYTPIAGGIDHGTCVWNGCVALPGAAVVTETIRIDAAPGPLTLTALAIAPNGEVVTATITLDVRYGFYLPLGG